MVLIRAATQAAYFVVSVATVMVVLITAHDPSQTDLLRRMTRENGVVEWSSVAVLTLILVVCLGSLLRHRKHPYLPNLARTLLVALGFTALLGALEEISWGQQVLGFRSHQFFLENNLQRETNLHNLMPASISSSIINTTVYILFLWIPCILCLAPASRLQEFVRERGLSVFVPKFSTMMIFAFGSTLQAYFLFPTWSDSVALIATFGLIAWMLVRQATTRWTDWSGLAWVAVCATIFALHHHVFRFANMQYEIRELVVVLGCLHWITDWADPGRSINPKDAGKRTVGEPVDLN